jgi:hypothetical protein
MEYEYDVFVSYSSTDGGWAARLEQALADAGLSVFRDKTRLAAGDKWDARLREAINGSQHLVALWSDPAKNSDWVARELYRFDALAEGDASRRLILLNLQGQNKSLTAFQSIDELNSAEQYQAGVEAVDVNRWSAVVDKIVAAVRRSDDSIPFTAAVLTMTADQLAKAGVPERLATVEQRLGIPAQQIGARYGASRLDWKPYGGPATIRTLLDGVVNHLNGLAADAGLRFRWEEVSSDLWADTATNKPSQAAGNLARAPLSLVIVDLLALRDDDVFQRCSILRQHVRKDTSAWIVVPPMPSDPRMLAYRELVVGWSRPLLDAYLDPPIPNLEANPPQYSIHCGDESELQRMVRTAAGRYVASRTPAGSGSPILRMRE